MKHSHLAYQRYLCEVIILIRDVAEETMVKLRQMKRDPNSLKDDIIFQDGRLLAYQEVLTTMMHQLETFQISLKEANFDKVDQKLLLCDKP